VGDAKPLGSPEGIKMNDDTTTRLGASPETRRAIIKWIVQAAVGLAGYGLILFLSAGRVDWVWALVIVIAAFLAAHPLILIPINPELLAEREKGITGKGVKSWDRWITALAAGASPIASWIVAGLDVRWSWTGPVSSAYHVGGVIVMVLGYALFLWAMASNAFFAEGVRIQQERGHTVAAGGPYRYMRHPGYVGATRSVSQVATPFLLGSAWALIPSVASAALYVVRTYLEDQTLRQELPGYEAYVQRTRYRLLPGVW
jgi:protein-S-isoprenylcysteine O-methyltransferase Ste14